MPRGVYKRTRKVKKPVRVKRAITLPNATIVAQVNTIQQLQQQLRDKATELHNVQHKLDIMTELARDILRGK